MNKDEKDCRDLLSRNIKRYRSFIWPLNWEYPSHWRCRRGNYQVYWESSPPRRKKINHQNAKVLRKQREKI